MANKPAIVNYSGQHAQIQTGDTLTAPAMIVAGSLLFGADSSGGQYANPSWQWSTETGVRKFRQIYNATDATDGSFNLEKWNGTTWDVLTSWSTYLEQFFISGNTYITGGLSATTSVNSGDSFNLNRAAGLNRLTTVSSSGVMRWAWGGESTAETGSDNGTNFGIYSYTDAGVIKGAQFTINRQSGQATFTVPPTLPTAAAGTNDTQAATTAFVTSINIQSVASSATVTPTFANKQVNITAQAAGLTLANPTGTAIDGWSLIVRIKDNGTPRAIGYGTQYRAIGVTLPTTTVASKTLYLGMKYNVADTKWDVLAVGQEA